MRKIGFGVIVLSVLSPAGVVARGVCQTDYGSCYMQFNSPHGSSCHCITQYGSVDGTVFNPAPPPIAVPSPQYYHPQGYGTHPGYPPPQRGYYGPPPVYPPAGGGYAPPGGSAKGPVGTNCGGYWKPGYQAPKNPVGGPQGC